MAKADKAEKGEKKKRARRASPQGSTAAEPKRRSKKSESVDLKESVSQAFFNPVAMARERLNKILAERTGQPMEVIERDTDRDNYMTAQQAKEYGLIDEVMVNSKSLK